MPRCPVCFVPMTRTEEEGLRGHTCPSCFGHWMPALAMLRRLRADVEKAKATPSSPVAPPVENAPTDNVTAAADDAAPPPIPGSATVPSAAGSDAASSGGSEQSPLADLAAIVAESDSKEPLRCPECEKVMRKDRYQQMIPVIVDRCKHCDRMWLDTGEFHLLRRLHLELAMSTDPNIIRLREKIAAVNMEWQSRPQLTQTVAASTSTTSDFANLTLDVLFGMLR